jgi:hypothetical protein
MAELCHGLVGHDADSDVAFEIFVRVIIHGFV